jgi:hypothetical protein
MRARSLTVGRRDGAQHYLADHIGGLAHSATGEGATRFLVVSKVTVFRWNVIYTFSSNSLSSQVPAPVVPQVCAGRSLSGRFTPTSSIELTMMMMIIIIIMTDSRSHSAMAARRRRSPSRTPPVPSGRVVVVLCNQREQTNKLSIDPQERDHGPTTNAALANRRNNRYRRFLSIYRFCRRR